MQPLMREIIVLFHINLIYITWYNLITYPYKDGQVLKSREILLSEHRAHWNAVRKKWHLKAHNNEQRFAQSAQILSTMFKRYIHSIEIL